MYYCVVMPISFMEIHVREQKYFMSFFLCFPRGSCMCFFRAKWQFLIQVYLIFKKNCIEQSNMSVNEKHISGSKYSVNECKVTFQSTRGQVSLAVSAHLKSESMRGWAKVRDHSWFLVHVWVCCERPASAVAPSSLKKQSFTWSNTHSGILTLYHFQEPLFTPAPE